VFDNDEAADFAKLPLQKLELKGNQLNVHTKFRLLWELPRLRVLDLSQNEISKLAGLCNKSLIEELLLCSNRLEDNGSIDFILKLPHLSTLRLDDNCITELYALVTNKTLKNVSLADNYIMKMEDVRFVTRLTQLRVLDLSRNQLKSFFFQFGQLQQLRQLSLAENKIEDLTQICFLGALPALEILQLQGNRLIGVMQQSISLERVKNALIGANMQQYIKKFDRLISAPTKLIGFLQLRELNLENNPALTLAAIRKLIQKMPKLEIVKWGGEIVEDEREVVVADVDVNKLEQELTAANTEVIQRGRILARYQQLLRQKAAAKEQLKLQYVHYVKFDVPKKTALINMAQSAQLNLDLGRGFYQ
jgi:Leucine-rich repeat (LRR) protein